METELETILYDSLNTIPDDLIELIIDYIVDEDPDGIIEYEISLHRDAYMRKLGEYLKRPDFNPHLSSGHLLEYINWYDEKCFYEVDKYKACTICSYTYSHPSTEHLEHIKNVLEEIVGTCVKPYIEHYESGCQYIIFSWKTKPYL